VQSTNFDKLFRVNEQIKAKEVRLIDDNAVMIGVVSVAEAIKKASQLGLDLVEVSPNAVPPVCKIANFGKMKYELQKKASDSKKKQKIIETKEVKMSINIGKGDYDVKIKQIAKFIDQGDKAKVSVKMRGREITHIDLANVMMSNIIADTENFAKTETPPRLEGMQIVATFIKK
jgi:translation initiation factor IF-3